MLRFYQPANAREHVPIFTCAVGKAALDLEVLKLTSRPHPDDEINPSQDNNNARFNNK